MKRLIVVLLALTLAVVAALVAKVDPGYVMMAYGNWSIETSAILLGMIILISFTAVYYTIRFFVNVGRIPGRTRDWRSNRKQTKANTALSSGLVELAEGRFDEAQKTLTKNPNDSITPTINYLSAARAAQISGYYQKRDDLLAIALKHSPEDSLAIGLTQAELMIEEGRFEQALPMVEQLHQENPKNQQALRLLAGLYQHSADLQKLKLLLPELHKHKAMTATELHSLAVQNYSRLLQQAAEDENLVTVLNTWADIPKDFKVEKALLVVYGNILVSKKSGESAEPLLRAAINKDWDSELVYLYGAIKTGNPQQQLKFAESWIKDHKNDASLMLTLGRLCLQSQLWGKARDYIEISINNKGPVEASYILAQLLSSLGENEKSLALYESALADVVGPLHINLPKPAETTDSDEPGSPARLKIIS